jgi:hypothetical protein
MCMRKSASNLSEEGRERKGSREVIVKERVCTSRSHWVVVTTREEACPVLYAKMIEGVRQ